MDLIMEWTSLDIRLVGFVVSLEILGLDLLEVEATLIQPHTCTLGLTPYSFTAEHEAALRSSTSHHQDRAKSTTLQRENWEILGEKSWLAGLKLLYVCCLHPGSIKTNTALLSSWLVHFFRAFKKVIVRCDGVQFLKVFFHFFWRGVFSESSSCVQLV